MIISDIEFILVLGLVFILFLKGLRKRTVPESIFRLDKSMSVGLKRF